MREWMCGDIREDTGGCGRMRIDVFMNIIEHTYPDIRVSISTGISSLCICLYHRHLFHTDIFIILTVNEAYREEVALRCGWDNTSHPLYTWIWRHVRRGVASGTLKWWRRYPQTCNKCTCYTCQTVTRVLSPAWDTYPDFMKCFQPAWYAYRNT